VLEPHVSHFADQVGYEPAYNGRGEGRVLLAGAKQAEGERLAGQQVVPKALDIDECADFSVCDLALNR
jgi:hypothetical protein